MPAGGIGEGPVEMDGMQLERCAAQLRALAEEARAGAARVAAVDSVEWRSLAAARFRAALQREAALGRRCAEVLDDAARAVAAHARAAAASGVLEGARAAIGVVGSAGAAIGGVLR